MKTGTENRPKVIAAVVLMVLAVALLGNWIFSMIDSPTPTTAAAAPSVDTPVSSPRTRTSAASKVKNPSKKVVSTAPRSLDPTLRFDWLRASEDTKYEGRGRNIFQPQAPVEIPKVVGRVNTDTAPQIPQGPPPPPPPPPINLKFFGFASKPGEPKSVFVAEGEDIFVAHEGQIVDRRYRIVRISPMAIEVEDVLNNNRQSIPLTQQ